MLERIWQGFGGDADFDAFVKRGGPALRGYATFAVLHEKLGGAWWDWPDEYVHPAAADVEGFATRNRARVDFHAWIQWNLDCQLRAASVALPVLNDIAVGVDPAGFDVCGGGSTSWPGAREVACHPTSPTPWARTGASRRSTHGSCGPQGTSRSSPCCGPQRATALASVSTT